MAHPTLATLAEHLGLSRATVTHVLNGRGDSLRIRPETQHRVREAAQALGYRANPSARAVRAGRFGNVALIQSLWGQYLPPELLHGLMSALTDKDLHLIFSQVQDRELEDETYLGHTFRDLAVDGMPDQVERYFTLGPFHPGRGRQHDADQVAFLTGR